MRRDHNVVHISVHIASDLLLEAILHCPLIGGSRVLQADGHKSIPEDPESGDESRLLLILESHLDLVITRVGIKEAHKLTSCSRIYDLVNTKQHKGILWAGLV